MGRVSCMAKNAVGNGQSQRSLPEIMAWVTHSVQQGLSWLVHTVWHWSLPSTFCVFHTFLLTNILAILFFCFAQEQILLLEEAGKDIYKRAHARLCMAKPFPRGGPFFCSLPPHTFIKMTYWTAKCVTVPTLCCTDPAAHNTRGNSNNCDL